MARHTSYLFNSLDVLRGNWLVVLAPIRNDLLGNANLTRQFALTSGNRNRSAERIESDSFLLGRHIEGESIHAPQLPRSTNTSTKN